jgi:hypothetical protein
MTLSHEYFNRMELSSSQIDIWSKLVAVFAYPQPNYIMGENLPRDNINHTKNS